MEFLPYSFTFTLRAQGPRIWLSYKPPTPWLPIHGLRVLNLEKKDFRFDLSLHFRPCKELLSEAFSCVYMDVYERDDLQSS